MPLDEIPGISMSHPFPNHWKISRSLEAGRIRLCVKVVVQFENIIVFLTFLCKIKALWAYFIIKIESFVNLSFELSIDKSAWLYAIL